MTQNYSKSIFGKLIRAHPENTASITFVGLKQGWVTAHERRSRADLPDHSRASGLRAVSERARQRARASGERTGGPQVASERATGGERAASGRQGIRTRRRCPHTESRPRE